MAIVPFVSSTFGALAGFGVLMVAVGLAFWRLERFCARQYWDGLHDYRLGARSGILERILTAARAGCHTRAR